MKYETLSDTATGTYSSAGVVTFTLTFANNIDHIVELQKIEGSTYSSELFMITDYSISNNVLTVECTSVTGLTGKTYYLFILATVASY